MRFSGNKIHCSPRDQSLSVYCNLLSICSNWYDSQHLPLSGIDLSISGLCVNKVALLVFLVGYDPWEAILKFTSDHLCSGCGGGGRDSEGMHGESQVVYLDAISRYGATNAKTQIARSPELFVMLN